MAKMNLFFFPKYLILIIVSFVLVGYLFIRQTSFISRVRCNSSTSCSELISLNEFQLRNDLTLSSSSRTLVIYVYGKTYPVAEQNLAFFIRTAVHPSQNADYYFILQQVDGIVIDETKLPILPSNAYYVQHENKCFDIGTIGWFLSSGMIDKTKYKYFIFLNSSVRGPFIVSYYDSPIWYTIFTRRLNDYIKLVGCTISCAEGPHVQSYLWTMDLETLDFLLKNSTVFTCHGSMNDAIFKGELGASQTVLQAGFGIDSLMIKYRGVDFRYDSARKCVDKLNPTFNKAANGITLDPYEVVFVKMKGVAAQDLDNEERVDVYEKWLHR